MREQHLWGVWRGAAHRVARVTAPLKVGVVVGGGGDVCDFDEADEQ